MYKVMSHNVIDSIDHSKSIIIYIHLRHVNVNHLNIFTLLLLSNICLFCGAAEISKTLKL